jgi:hypothetical protein
MAIAYLACMALVARIYALPPRVLPSIHAVEGGQVGSIHHNDDGSDDLGVMQINTRWIQPLVRYTGAPPEIVQTRLINEPCYNIAAAGAILRTYLDQEHGNLMRAVGDYHSHTPELNLSYQALVLGAATRLFVHPGGSGGR